VQVEGLVLGALETNCWLVEDGKGGPLVVIDPAGDADALLASIGARPVAAVVLTHGHFDHLGAASALIDVTGAPLAVHRLDAAAITDPWANGGLGFGFDYRAPEADRLLEDGDVVEAGDLRLKVLHTPGHTPGSICLFAPAAPDGSDAPHLCSGDTLFARSVGRTDFPGGDARALSRSIATKLAPLPAETKIHTGHGPDTTIGHEARVNPFWPR
jgi:glyoxylase-like metal-dependent hydrolase (beta-lactamase superfamily II)